MTDIEGFSGISSSCVTPLEGNKYLGVIEYHVRGSAEIVHARRVFDDEVAAKRWVNIKRCKMRQKRRDER